MKILDANQKQEVQYCIPLWLRDEQIKLAKARGLPTVKPGERKDEPIAIVCFGPSLVDTWEKIKSYKYVMTCSGSHKFMVDRGIIPTWHVEVDPREHKVKLQGQPQKDTEYLIAATCHPKVFDHLKDFKVTIWNVFDPTEEGKRAAKPGEWAVTGGCSVGLRAMTLAAFLGFRDLQIFGMDGSEGKTGKHAAEHPNQAKGHCIVNHRGVDYKTTPGFLEAARQTWHELDQMPAVTATFHGEGLVQSMSKDYVRKTIKSDFLNDIAIEKVALISDEYKELNKKLHHDNLAYGVGGGRHAPKIAKIADSIKTRSVLDYGCGKGYLQKALDFPIWEYDPAIPGKDETPRPADLVVCADVLEHIEEDKIELVIDDLFRCTKKVGFFVIHTGPSMKFLADGRNAHILQRPKEWWIEKLEKQFKIGQMEQRGHELFVLVGPKYVIKKKKKEKLNG